MLVTMSDKELSRINVIQSVIEKRMRRRDAAHQLALTERQTQRLMNRFRESGAAGLANLRRGRPGNHRLPESLKLRVLSLLHEHYSDFGPTLAAEKLRERHDITVSVETLRKWMTSDGLWVPYSRRRPRVHQPRYRRDCLGELVQNDGSPHDWFEGRAPKCSLLVFIDDATGRLMHLRFGETESLLKQHICRLRIIFLAEGISSLIGITLSVPTKVNDLGTAKYCPIVTPLMRVYILVQNVASRAGQLVAIFLQNAPRWTRYI